MYTLFRLVTWLLIFNFSNICYALEIKTIQPQELSTYINNNGKIKLLYTFTSWCGVCRKNMPELFDLASAYDDDEVEVFLISLDDRLELTEKVMQPYNEYKARVLHLDNSNISNMLKGLNSVGISYRGGVPHTTLITQSGEVAVDGNYSLAPLKKGIDHLLAHKGA